MAILRLATPYGGRIALPAAAGLLARVIAWDARFRARRHLATLSPERRADLGLTAAEIAAETAKPFWRD